MAKFRRKVIAAVSPCTSTALAVGGTGLVSAGVGTGRARAMALPTIKRARDINASLIGSLPIRRFGTQWNGEYLEEIPLPPEPWQMCPDPKTTRAHMLSWTFDDMLFSGVAYWLVTRRYKEDMRPAEFKWLPAAYVSVVSPLYDGNVPIGGISNITYNGQPLNPDDVIAFYSPTDPLLEAGWRAIRIAEKLDAAAERFACTELPAGYLRITGGEPPDQEFLQALGDTWSDARRTNTTAVLTENLEYVPTNVDASAMQLTEGRQHAALDLSRAAMVPAYLVGAPTSSGMTYNNAQDATRSAVLFGALGFIEVIEQTLSSDRITPRGQIIRLDRSAWVNNPLDSNAETPAEQPEKANA